MQNQAQYRLSKVTPNKTTQESAFGPYMSLNEAMGYREQLEQLGKAGIVVVNMGAE